MSEEKKLLNEVIIFVFFSHKKLSRSFINVWLNHWCHMDYFTALNMVVELLSTQGQKSSDFIKNIFICILKMKEGLMGLERHEGEVWQNFHFWK